MALGRQKLKFFEKPFVSWRNDIALFMGPRLAGYSAVDVDDLTAVELRSRQLTVGHRFLRVLSTDSGHGVGDVWFWIDSENKQAFLYYIAIMPEHRRSGFASAALTAIEEMVRAAGCISVGLNVFSSNHGAIALYRKLGFCTVASYWNKPL